MQKSKWQMQVEKMKPFGEKGPYMIEKRKILSQEHGTQVPVGETVTVSHWGTFGCWDTKNRWVSLYDSSHVETIKNLDRK